MNGNPALVFHAHARIANATTGLKAVFRPNRYKGIEYMEKEIKIFVDGNRLFGRDQDGTEYELEVYVHGTTVTVDPVRIVPPHNKE